MQRQVLKMLEGTAADVEPGFADKTYLTTGASVSGAEWKRLLDAGHVYIWLDYSSVPVSRAPHSNTLAFYPPPSAARLTLACTCTRSKLGPTTTATTTIQAT